MNRTEGKFYIDLAKNASSYEEVKIKLDMAGLDMYNIDVIRKLRTHLKHKIFFYKFEEDIRNNIEKIFTTEYISKMFVRIFEGNVHIGEFERFIYGIFFNEYDMKLVKKSSNNEYNMKLVKKSSNKELK